MTIDFLEDHEIDREIIEGAKDITDLLLENPK